MRGAGGGVRHSHVGPKGTCGINLRFTLRVPSRAMEPLTCHVVRMHGAACRLSTHVPVSCRGKIGGYRGWGDVDVRFC